MFTHNNDLAYNTYAIRDIESKTTVLHRPRRAYRAWSWRLVRSTIRLTRIWIPATLCARTPEAFLDFRNIRDCCWQRSKLEPRRWAFARLPSRTRLRRRMKPKRSTVTDAILSSVPSHSRETWTVQMARNRQWKRNKALIMTFFFQLKPYKWWWGWGNSRMCDSTTTDGLYIVVIVFVSYAYSAYVYVWQGLLMSYYFCRLVSSYWYTDKKRPRNTTRNFSKNK